MRLPLLIERKGFEDAIHSIETSHLDKPAKALWMAANSFGSTGGTISGTRSVRAGD